MPKTYTFPIPQVPAQVPIVTKVRTKRAVLQEDASVAKWPTTAFQIYSPKATDEPVTYPPGAQFVFDTGFLGSAWPAGYTLGYISVTKGPTVFSQVEDGLL